MDLVDERQLAGLRLLPLALPALQLPLDVGLLAAELAEADLVGIDLVDRDQRVDDALADRPALVLVEALGLLAPSAGSAPRRSPSRRRARRSRTRPRRGRPPAAPGPACPAGRRSPGARAPCRGRSRAACRAADGGAPRRGRPSRGRRRSCSSGRPEIRSKLSGSSTPGTFASNQPSTPARSIPSGCLGSLLPPCRREHMRRCCFDFGGVLTTLGLGQLRRLLPRPRASSRTRSRTSSRPTRRRSRTSASWRPARSARTSSRPLRQRLGLDGPRGPDRQHVRRDAARAERWSRPSDELRRSGLQTGLISNSWSTAHYDRAAARRALRRRR